MEKLSAHLHRGFDYDLWANLRWLDWLDNLPDPAHAREIMRHVARAQFIWLKRLQGIERDFDEDAPLDGQLSDLGQKWKALLSHVPLNQRFHWTRLDGAERDGILEDIARHVINHGTYHRGHLRGLADAAGVDAFEDTDFARYFEVY